VYSVILLFKIYIILFIEWSVIHWDFNATWFNTKDYGWKPWMLECKVAYLQMSKKSQENQTYEKCVKILRKSKIFTIQVIIYM
jgi:hypothetical protein